MPDETTEDTVDIIANTVLASEVLAHLSERGTLEWQLAIERNRVDRLITGFKNYIRSQQPSEDTPPQPPPT